MKAKRIMESATASCLALSCAACEPEAIQAAIDGRLGVFNGWLVSWAAYAPGFVDQLLSMAGMFGA